MNKKEYNNLSESEKAKEDWLNSKWRPTCGWIYIVVCIFDFILFPIMWSILQAMSKGQVNMQWQPITLQGAGLFHMSMGLVLGVSAYGRTQEKLNGVSNGGFPFPPNIGTSYIAPLPFRQSNSNTDSIENSFSVNQRQNIPMYDTNKSSLVSRPSMPKYGKLRPEINEPEL